MSRLELLDGKTIADFLAAPAAVLMLGKSDCEACADSIFQIPTPSLRDDRL